MITITHVFTAELINEALRNKILLKGIGEY